MPKTKETQERTQMRLPKSMTDEIDRIVHKFPIYSNRQQFIESAVREKLEKVWAIEAGLQHATEQPHK